ncbi:tRNA (adenosine(37)-N6)-dimethylallyltransferase MiaA [Fodinicurvata sediminis]|uniref:tRNA (adenosine(37)-N6)-dimethylallyltransferase MiaA n=1 Tax=Fodinicurvata sediminis TaxID=1121832 RepID=UPI0003B50C8E|nr:tRNA (adenosine(37)-N6)-dimethylallyltransferase MiaA [Fodinicurvata sediminis]
MSQDPIDRAPVRHKGLVEQERDPSVKADLPPAVVVAGPTASGKSGLALRLAEAFKGTVINADSLQVYRDIPLLSAQPGKEEQERVPHRLYGFADADARFTAAHWAALAEQEMQAAELEGRLPILTGGTGLYLKALEEGLATAPAVAPETRDSARRRLEDLGREAFVEEVRELDPETARRLHPNDTQRLLRAWEVARETGRSLSAWQRETSLAPAPWRFFWLVLLPPRAELGPVCDQRFLEMVDAGALEEVRRLIALEPPEDATIRKAVGVRELAAHLDGALSLEAAIQAAQQATRRYAKRQTTWLRTQVLRHKQNVHLEQTKFSESAEGRIFPIIRQFVLTPHG